MDVNAALYLLQKNQNLLHFSMAIQNDPTDAGLLLTLIKSNWVPRKLAIWFGFDINLEINSAKSKIEALQRQFQQVLSNNFMSARNITRLTGRTISTPQCKIHDPGALRLIEYQTYLVSYTKSLTRSCTINTILVV